MNSEMELKENNRELVILQKKIAMLDSTNSDLLAQLLRSKYKEPTVPINDDVDSHCVWNSFEFFVKNKFYSLFYWQTLSGVWNGYSPPHAEISLPLPLRKSIIASILKKWEKFQNISIFYFRPSKALSKVCLWSIPWLVDCGFSRRATLSFGLGAVFIKMFFVFF